MIISIRITNNLEYHIYTQINSDKLYPLWISLSLLI